MASFDLTDVSAERLRSAFESAVPLTLGLEEEVMLLDPETLDLSPTAPEALSRLDGDRRFKGELPASQLEIVTDPAPDAAAAIAALAQGRRDLSAVLGDRLRLAVAAVHPFAAGEGQLSPAKRYQRTQAAYGPAARRQLVAALQVHVAVGGAERTLAVYNSLRSHLPEVAALAANAPFYEGRDAGMASVRPAIAKLLPRQGVPPQIDSWEQLAGELRWGARIGSVAEARQWWWELRPHPSFGTLEVRVPDAQTTLAEASAVAAFVQALVADLAQRHDAGERLAVAPTWRIEENRWSAARHGVDGEMADLETGERQPTRERLRARLSALELSFERLDSTPYFDEVRRLVEVNGAMRQREVAAAGDLRDLVAWIADRFLAPESTSGEVLRTERAG